MTNHYIKTLGVAKCNQIDALHSSLIATLEREKDFALKQGKSERMFALRRCLTVLKRGGHG